jgi:hypothetical protein
MQRLLFGGIFLAGLGLAMSSCITWKPASEIIVPFRCVVQSATESMVLYEIALDGKLVASGRTLPKEKGAQILEFTAATGDHVLTVTAPGCEKWEKTIAILNAVSYGQTFLIELQKAEKPSPEPGR